jgi:quercetin dioxygenase-like cupin family protein
MNDTSKSVEDVGVLQQLGNSFEERRAAVTAKRQARLRRDCLNHVLIFSEQHLRQVLKSYAVTLLAPIPDLKPGGYDLNLTRVTFPAHMPSNPPHHRSGAALYYIISGTGANTVDGKTEAKGPGSLIYEPFGLVHQWGNPGDEPLTFLAFNINPDGVGAVLPGAPAKTKLRKDIR